MSTEAERHGGLPEHWGETDQQQGEKYQDRYLFDQWHRVFDRDVSTWIDGSEAVVRLNALEQQVADAMKALEAVRDWPFGRPMSPLRLQARTILQQYKEKQG